MTWNNEMVPRLGLHMYTAEIVNLHKRQLLHTDKPVLRSHTRESQKVAA